MLLCSLGLRWCSVCQCFESSVCIVLDLVLLEFELQLVDGFVGLDCQQVGVVDDDFGDILYVGV